MLFTLHELDLISYQPVLLDCIRVKRQINKVSASTNQIIEGQNHAINKSVIIQFYEAQ